MKKVLITGGSGLIGLNVTKKLLEHGYEVTHLTRSKNSKGGVRTFEWDWKNKFIDPKAFKGITDIIHLAGENIAEKPWTRKQKLEIINSRTKTTLLLAEEVAKSGIQINSFISASGTGFYGAVTCDTIFSEDAPYHMDFIGRCTYEWEKSAEVFKKICRVVHLRTPLVLSTNGGGLTKMSPTIKMGIGAPLGNGTQYMPWIHEEDLSNAYLWSIDKNIKGSFNICADQHCTNSEFTYTLAKVLNRKIRLKKIPAFVLRTIYGELADLLLTGSRVSNNKIKEEGFNFNFPILENALRDLLPTSKP